MKSRKLSLFIIVSLLGLFAVPGHSNPYVYTLDPALCTPPPPPSVGQPGYGPGNPLGNGAYYDPMTGLWVYPEGFDQPDRGERMIEASEEIIELLNRPDWASAPPANGAYYFSGGFWNSSNWYEPGYYFPNEIF